MFKKTAPTQSIDNLETAINKLFEDMSNISPDSEEFAGMVAQMDVLYKLKAVDSDVSSKKRVSPDAMAAILANLVGIAMIVGHERANVVTSKALSMIQKLR